MKIRTISMISSLVVSGLGIVVAADDPFADAGASEAAPEESGPFAPEDVMDDPANDDPFADAAYGWGPHLVRIPALRLTEKRERLRVRVEVWEVLKSELALEMDRLDGPNALERWRELLLKSVATRLMHAPVVVVDSKSRNSVEGIVERIYPTEYEPPEMLPEKAIEQLMAVKKPQSLQEMIGMVTSSATATAFETRNTGVSLEAAIQPVTGEENRWDLSLLFEDVVFSGMENHGAAELGVKMPTFTVFRSGGLRRVEEGRWQLVSAIAPPHGLMTPKNESSWVTIVRVDPIK